MGGLRAGGGDAQYQVVDITLVVVGSGHERSDVIGSLQGETIASAGETAREKDLRRVGRRTGIDNHRVNRGERAHIRTGHRTNHETERIRGAVTAGIEGELQVVNRIGIDIQSGQNGILVSIARRGVAVEAQAVAAARRIRGTVIDIRIVGIGRTAVVGIPAVSQVVGA